MRRRGRGGAGLFPRLLLDRALTLSYFSYPTASPVRPWSPPLPQPARSPHSQTKLTFLGGGCISAPAQAATRLRNSRKPRPPRTPAPDLARLRPHPAHIWSGYALGREAQGVHGETKSRHYFKYPRNGTGLGVDAASPEQYGEPQVSKSGRLGSISGGAYDSARNYF